MICAICDSIKHSIDERKLQAKATNYPKEQGVTAYDKV